MTVLAKFNLRDRGSTPRGMARRINAMKKQSWDAAAILFHAEMRDARFSHAHARAAGYAPRSRMYEKRKLKRFGHTYPLQFTGRTRRAVNMARITTTGRSARVAYAGARVLNFRNPKSQVNAVLEFTTIIQNEADRIAKEFDNTLDRLLNSDQTENP